MQKAGHIPIAVVGGGTAMVGDPSSKTEMRQLLSEDFVIQVYQLKADGVPVQEEETPSTLINLYAGHLLALAEAESGGVL